MSNDRECQIRRALKQIASGDQNAFWLIWLQYDEMLKQRCIGWTTSVADAEDAHSIACLRCYEKISQVASNIKNIEAWLTTVTFNICMDIHRGYRREMGLSLPAPHGAALLEKLEENELHSKLDKGISSLPEMLRAVVELRLSESSYQEISVRLGISIQSAYKLNSRARNQLREMFQDEISPRSKNANGPTRVRMTKELTDILSKPNRGHEYDNELRPICPKCPQCRSDVVVRNGSRDSQQRFRCKNCRHQYTAMSQSMAARQQQRMKITQEMAGLGKGVKAIARELDVSPKTVRRWIRGRAERASS